MTANRGLMLSLFFALLFILLSILPARVCAQQIYEIENPKREVRAVWLTTISGLDWPRTRAVSQSGIERQKRELVDILPVQDVGSRVEHRNRWSVPADTDSGYWYEFEFLKGELYEKI